MNEQKYSEKLKDLLTKVDNLPDHGSEAVRIAAEQLEGMSADLTLGIIEIDPGTINGNDVKRQIREIDELSFEKLSETRNFEKPFSGGDKGEWSRNAKMGRMELLVKQYSLLCGLRSDDPEAWDEVNELFYDD